MRSLSLVALGVAVIAFPIAATSAFAGQSDQQDFQQIERGRYLATLADCTACHTKKDGSPPFGGGRPIETPFGTIVAPNITPDAETGIGNWTDDQFDNAVRRGIRADGARLYPAMPYTAYTKMSRKDVMAIRAYLSTVAPVHNSVVANQLPFPFNIRLAMRVWDGFFFNKGEFKPDPNKSAEWNRGAFLVTGPAHCGACHTPKNLLGADKNAQALQGAPVQGWVAPNITNDMQRGLGAWSVDEIVALLKTGHNQVTGVTGPMGEEVSDSSSHFDDADLKAIATYLKAMPSEGDKGTPLAQSDSRMVVGQAIYRDVCAACHELDGKGVANLFPSLAAPSVRANDPTSAIRVVLRGARSVATSAEPTAPAMPSFAWQLKDDQIAAVLTYVRNSWGGSAGPISADDVKKQRAQLANRTD